MNWSNVKWMLLGCAVAMGGVWVYNNHNSIIKNLGTGTHDNYNIKSVNPEFARYIHAFTTGYVSSGSVIKIKLSSQLLETIPLNEPIKEKLFSFDEELEGKAYWTDAETIEFRPDKRMEPGKLYKATFYLGKLATVKEDIKEFNFQFKVVEQSLQVEINDLSTINQQSTEYYRSSGTLYTADFAEAQKVEKTLVAKYDGKDIKLKWSHDEKGLIHRFYADSLERGMLMTSKLKFDWNAESIGAKSTGSEEIQVPAKNSFTLMNIRVINSPEQFVQIALSNPLSENQSLEGLILPGDWKDSKITTEYNHIRIYPNETRSGTLKVKVSELIQDVKGKKLDKAYERQLMLEEIKPAIKFLGNGVILPNSTALTVNFETVNLKAVDVRVIKVFENNMLQFLQNNELDGSEELARVGKKMAEKRIVLGITNPADFKRLKRFSLDLSSLIKPEPGAIYRVSLSYNKSYSTYSCNGEANTNNIELEQLTETVEETEPVMYYSDYGSSGYYEYETYGEEEGYSWDERDNPCNPAYYSSYKTNVSRNFLSSDIGLTVKSAESGELMVAAASILTTKPMEGVELELYDYQQQLLQTAKTNKEGIVFIGGKKPYFIIAKKEKQRAYVKLNNATSLSLSMFDTGGDHVQKGLKGFIYGERGVWRPGDTLFLSFMLEDKLKTLPPNHPVKFELINPQGMVYKRVIKAKGQDGFYTFPVVTDKNAPTGMWRAVCQVGAVYFVENIRIETVMPNRLKINVNTGDDQLLRADKKENIQLHANWLTGAIAKSLKATVAVSLTKTNTSFKGYNNYQFDDPSANYQAQSITLFDGQLNDKGDANFPLNINTEGNAPGILKASFATRVYEQGGAFSVDRFSLNYSPYSHYVGIKRPEGEKNSGILYTGKDHEINLAIVNAKGEPVSSSRLRVMIYKMGWRWWWDQYEDEWANYSGSEYHEAYKTIELADVKGKASFKMNIPEESWGRYLIRVTDVESGHSSAIITYFDWANWMERGGKDNKIVASLLHFTTDKESYQNEEEVTVNIPSPKGGRALVTIETGSKILQAHWVETEKGNTRFKFKVTEEMAPNVYVHISLIQAHAQTMNDLPIRLYGVMPVKVDNKETHLRPLLKMNDVLVPETKAAITVAEENGKEMTYTLAMVDEGLLDLTRFKTPDPWPVFYAREALGIKTWDIYDQVIGAYGGELERILSIGGDDEVQNKDGAKTNRFVPMVRFIGPFHLGKGEKKTHEINMPMYVGSVRVMLIAGYNGAYGSTDKTVAVKSPLMLLGTLPRVLSTDEEVSLPVTVFSGENSLNKVAVSVQTNNAVQLLGEQVQYISMKKNEEQMLYFKLKVKRQTGLAKVKITAQANGKTTSYAMELDVRNPNPYRTDVKEFIVEAGDELSQNYTGIGITGTNSGAMEISAVPAINVESRLKYLIEYPHGCVEQTTSSVFPQLFLEDITFINADRKSRIENNIRAAIHRLEGFQLKSGGFSYWPGMGSENDWGTAYASHFLLMAEKKGYTLPGSMKQNFLKYLQTVSSYWQKQNRYGDPEFTQAYRLYVLALAGKPDFSSMNRLREEANMSLQSRWRLAATYALAGNSTEAEKIINKLPAEISKYHVDYYTYGSSTRDEAMILETLCLLDKKTNAFMAMKNLAKEFSGNAWYSTQTTAYSLVAFSSFVKKYGGTAVLQAQVELDGKQQTLQGNSPINSIPLSFGSKNGGTLKIKNNGKGPLFVKLMNTGKPPVGEEKEEQQGLNGQVRYLTAKGEEINPEQLQQGTDFIMEITVRSNGTAHELKNLALTSYIPSGWEIHNARMDDNEAAMKNSVFDYQDIRDDRVFTYFDLRANEVKVFRIGLNASYCGNYYLPGINLEAMYDNSYYLRKKGKWINVVKQ